MFLLMQDIRLFDWIVTLILIFSALVMAIIGRFYVKAFIFKINWRMLTIWRTLTLKITRACHKLVNEDEEYFDNMQNEQF